VPAAEVFFRIFQNIPQDSPSGRVNPGPRWSPAGRLPGTRALPRNQSRPDMVINPVKIAEAFWYLHTQDRSCWSHEVQPTPFPVKPSY